MNQVTLDARWLTTGVGTYTWNLLTRLKSCAEMHLRCLTLAQNKEKVAPYCDEVRVVDAAMYSMAEQLAVPAAASGSDLLHATHYNAPLLYPGKLVVSIHDLNHILDATFRRTWKSRLYARPMFALAARKAVHILTLSEYSKRQIVEHLNVPNEKVSVTYCGVSSDFFSSPTEDPGAVVARECGVSRPYLLYVGNLKPHKNVPGLLRAFALARLREARECQLLIIGDDPVGGPALKKLASELSLAEAVKFAPRVTDATLRAAYTAAELTIVPSFEEGFGLPIVESMACGTPVACSAAASMPEVGGNAVEYFDPHRAESIAAVFAKILSSSSVRERMRERGLRQARRFTWEACVQKIVSVYQDVTQN